MSRSRTHHPALALAAALLSLLVSIPSLLLNPVLSDLEGLTDEWLYLGLNLAMNGTIGLWDDPNVFRPPGYPAFEALVFKTFLELPPQYDRRFEPVAGMAMYASHCLLLAAASALTYLWLSPRTKPLLAFAAAVLFGTTPYAVVLTTMRHYEVFHWVWLLASGLALEALWARPPSARRAVAVGALLGAATLVRPVTLILPPFLLLVARLRRGAWCAATRETAWLVLGFALAILPWTARNLAVSGRLVPVSAQLWNAVFVATDVRLPLEADRYCWIAVIEGRYMEVYTQVTGDAAYSYGGFVRHLLPLEDRYRRESVANLRRQPLVYAQNVVRAFVSMQTSVNAVVLTVFRRMREGQEFTSRWILFGHPRNLVRGAEAHAFAGLAGILTVLATLGVVSAARTRDGFVAVPLALHLTLSVAHAVTYLDMRYYYVKLPFLVVMAFYALDRMGRPGLVAGLALLACSLVLTAWTLFL